MFSPFVIRHFPSSYGGWGEWDGFLEWALVAVVAVDAFVGFRWDWLCGAVVGVDYGVEVVFNYGFVERYINGFIDGSAVFAA